MAYDVFSGQETNRDWSLGEDLPVSARGYAPMTYWDRSQMEAKVAEIMSKRGGLFGIGPKPSRQEAIVELVKHMKANKIGPRDMTSGIGAEVGSLLLPVKEQKALHNKIDDVRYDIRGAKSVIGAGFFALSGALAMLGIASIYRTRTVERRS